MFRILAVMVVGGACAFGQPYFDPLARDSFLQSEVTTGKAMEFGLGVLYDQATVAVPEWGPKRNGLVKRIEMRGVSWAAKAATEYSIASLRGSNVAYKLCDCKGFPKRFEHAVKFGMYEYKPDGTRLIGYSRFAGFAAGAIAQMPLLPGKYGAKEAATRALVGLGVQEGLFVFREFRKEVTRTLTMQKVKVHPRVSAWRVR